MRGGLAYSIHELEHCCRTLAHEGLQRSAPKWTWPHPPQASSTNWYKP